MEIEKQKKKTSVSGRVLQRGVRVTLYFSVAAKAKLVKTCEEENISMSYFMAQLVLNYEGKKNVAS